jgi:hypothetical protein
MARSSTSGQGRKPGIPNKITRPIRELAGNFSEHAIKTLVQIMIDQMAPPAARVSAAKELLDRAHGKSSASANITLPAGGMADQGKAMIEAAASGQLPLDHLSVLMGALSAQARIVETGELVKRMDALEAAQGGTK